MSQFFVIVDGGNPPSNPVTPSQGGTGVINPTAHTLPVAEGAAPFNFLGPLTNGQLLIGSTGADPVPASLTAGANITITNSAGGISIAASGGGGGITEYFSTYLSAPTGNVTGDNTLYGPILFDGIITNSSSSYNPATGLYTAPSTGQYSFQHTVSFNGGDISTTSYLSIWVGSAFSARAFQLSPVAQAGSNTIIFSASIFIHMTAGDTMGIQVLVAGTTKDVLIYGAPPASLAVTSLFSGYKIA